jgi:hypothetical protein
MNPGSKKPAGPVASAPATVRVEIGVLSLPSGSRARGVAIASALQAELARLLGSEAAQDRLRKLAGSGAIAPDIDAGLMHPGRADRPERLGTRIGGLVVSGLLGASEPRRRR